MISSLDTVPGGIVALTRDLRILSTNQVVSALVGREPAELTGLPFDDLLATPSRILFQTHVYPALAADGRVEEAFLTLASPDENSTPILLNVTRVPADGSDDDTTTYLALVVRIRARAQWQTDLLKATRAIEREHRRTTEHRDRLIQTQRELTQANQLLQRTLDDLNAASREVQRLREIVPMCAWCRRIRVDGPGESEWLSTEAFLARDQLAVSHGMCDDCMAREQGSLS
jgi:hypothetical protein